MALVQFTSVTLSGGSDLAPPPDVLPDPLRELRGPRSARSTVHAAVRPPGCLWGARCPAPRRPEAQGREPGRRGGSQPQGQGHRPGSAPLNRKQVGGGAGLPERGWSFLREGRGFLSGWSFLGGAWLPECRADLVPLLGLAAGLAPPSALQPAGRCLRLASSGSNQRSPGAC